MKTPLNDLIRECKELDDYSSNLKKKNCKIISYLKNKSKINSLLLNTKEIKQNQFLNGESSKLYFKDEKVNNLQNKVSNYFDLLNNDSMNVKNELRYKSSNQLNEFNIIPNNPPGKKKRKEKAAFLNKIKTFSNVEENKYNKNIFLKEYKNSTIRKKEHSNEYNVPKIENNYDIKNNIYIKCMNVDRGNSEKYRINYFSPKEELTINQNEYNFINNYNKISRKKCNIKNNNSNYDNLLQIYEHKYLKIISNANRKSSSKHIYKKDYSVNLLNDKLNNKLITDNNNNYQDKKKKINYLGNSKIPNSNTYEEINNQNNLKHTKNNNLNNYLIKRETDKISDDNNNNINENNNNVNSININENNDNVNSNNINENNNNVNSNNINENNDNDISNNEKSIDDNNINNYKQRLKINNNFDSIFKNEFKNNNYSMEINFSKDKKMNNDIRKVIKSINTLYSFIKDNVASNNKIREEIDGNYFNNDYNMNFNEYSSIDKEQNLHNYARKKYIEEFKILRKKQKKKIKIIQCEHIRKKQNKITKKKIGKLNKKIHIKISQSTFNLEKEIRLEEKKKFENKIKKEEIEYLQEMKNNEKRKIMKILDNGINKSNAELLEIETKDLIKKVDETKCKDIKSFIFSELKNELSSNLLITNDNKSYICNNKYIYKDNNLKLDKNIKSPKEINKNRTKHPTFFESTKYHSNKESINYLKKIKNINVRNFLIYKKKKIFTINKNNSKNINLRNITTNNIKLKKDNNEILLKNNIKRKLKSAVEDNANLTLSENENEDITKNSKGDFSECSVNIERFNNISKNIFKEECPEIKNYNNNYNLKEYITIRINNKQNYEEKKNIFDSNKFNSLNKSGFITKESENINIFCKSKNKEKKNNLGNLQNYRKELKRKNNIFNKSVNKTLDKKLYENNNYSFFPILLSHNNIIYIEEQHNRTYIYLVNNLNNVIHNIFKYKNKILFFHVFFYIFNLFLFYKLLNTDLLNKQGNFATKETICILYFMIIEFYLLFLNNAIFFFLKSQMRKAIALLDKVNLIYSLSKLFPKYYSYFKRHFSILEDIDKELHKKNKKIINSNNFEDLLNSNCIIKSENNLNDLEKLNNKKENNSDKINQLDKLNNLDFIPNNEEKKKNKKKSLKGLIRKTDKNLDFNTSKNCKNIYIYPSNNENSKYFNDKVKYKENKMVQINKKIKSNDKINFNYSKSRYQIKKYNDKEIIDFMFFILSNQKNLNLDKLFFLKLRKYTNYLIIFFFALLIYITVYFEIKDPFYFYLQKNCIFFTLVSFIILIQILFCIIIEIKKIFVEEMRIFLNKRIINLEYPLYIYINQKLK
ncbi:conserved Plasmodium protein, unknown function [Plasmodium gallinaceum]|uniref:Uncharacterized protein n=1 Tax=Plasmodium gallinaceum TaxID=5849 RepID=A0A1J1GY87_PLAGA|nr:conserved Plasmodium protein, unknown function [Plasmodium gallinaceum]CRG97448.1 conserved Plasmodium protein, unknown function [Plasmodium gallinaceum]